MTTDAKAKKRTFKEVESNFRNLTEKNETIEGTIVSRDIVTFNGGGSAGRYKIEDDEGEITALLGSTVLDDMLQPIPNGTYVKVTLLGYETKKGSPNKTKKYKLEVAD